MIFWRPAAVIVLIYVLAAVLPAFFLMRYIYRQDRVEREPMGLLLRLILAGVISALLAGIVEGVAQTILDAVMHSRGTLYYILLAFVVVAAVEEGTKFLLLKSRTWRSYHFNYRFDGIVYAVFVSLGFAAYENILYVFQYGLSVALPRALMAVPGHMAFAVFMGVFYGRAKLCESWGDDIGCRVNLWAGYLAAVLLHGFYDACAMIGSALSTVIFVAFVIAMYFIVIRVIRREARTDRPV